MPVSTLPRLLCAALLCLSSALAVAADAAGNYAIWGLGAQSCFQYSKAQDSERAPEYRHYAMGYLTAYNLFQDDTYSVTGQSNLTQIMGRLSLYCEENQLDSFDRAIKVVVEGMLADATTDTRATTKTWGRAPEKVTSQQ